MMKPIVARLLAGSLLLLILPAPSRADDKPKELLAPPKGFDAKREAIEGGKVETVECDSKSIGVKRKMLIYIPPGYLTGRNYPVLYLLHSGGDDETAWVQKGGADVILDNLYAGKKLVPMMVVMPYGRATASQAWRGRGSVW